MSFSCLNVFVMSIPILSLKISYKHTSLCSRAKSTYYFFKTLFISITRMKKKQLTVEWSDNLFLIKLKLISLLAFHINNIYLCSTTPAAYYLFDKKKLEDEWRDIFSSHKWKNHVFNDISQKKTLYIASQVTVK